MQNVLWNGATTTPSIYNSSKMHFLGSTVTNSIIFCKLQFRCFRTARSSFQCIHCVNANTAVPLTHPYVSNIICHMITQQCSWWNDNQAFWKLLLICHRLLKIGTKFKHFRWNDKQMALCIHSAFCRHLALYTRLNVISTKVKPTF